MEMVGIVVDALTYITEDRYHHVIIIEPSLAFLPSGEKMITSYHNELHEDLCEWLDDNFSDWRYDWDTFDEPKIYFNNTEEAMGFLLRWT